MRRKLFTKAYPNEPQSGADTVDTLIRLPMLKIMSHKADQGGANVYAYMFTHQEGAMGAFYGAEISYAFYNSSEKNGMNELISSVWTNFARNGVPSADGLRTKKKLPIGQLLNYFCCADFSVVCQLVAQQI